jgi:hypothetical protein
MSKTKTPSPKALKEAAIAKAKTAFVFHPQSQSKAMIRTRYLQGSGLNGPRMKAYTRSGRKGEPSLVMSYDHELEPAGNHAKAACALALWLGWVTEEGSKVLCGGNGDDGTASFVIINLEPNGEPKTDRNNAKGARSA